MTFHRTQWVVLMLGFELAGAAAAGAEPPILSTSESNISEETIGRRYGMATLGKTATDPAYGYSDKEPVQVGGGFGEGGHNVYRFLNALLGPAGQEVHYTRVGTCCPFKTPNAIIGDEGILEVYEITYEGGEARRLYFDWYDKGELLVPKGLTARGAER